MNLAFLALLPAALLIDRLFGELPSRVHPVCMMGALASRIEALFRRGSNNALMSLSGTLACLLVVLPCAALAGGWRGPRRFTPDPQGGMVRLGHHHLDLLSRPGALTNTPCASPSRLPRATSKARARPFP